MSTAARPTSRASEALAAALAAGRWPAMSRLPGEVHLAAELGVARGTVRRALAQLAQQGRLISRPHAGYIVAPGAGAGDGGSALAGTVVLVTATGLLDFPFAEEYPAATVIGAQRAAAALGAHLMLVSRWDAATQQAIAARRPSAVVVADIVGADSAEPAALAERLPGIPLVWHADPDDASGVDCAACDQNQGGRLLVGFARARRRSQALLLATADERSPWWRRRRDGIATAWSEAGLSARTLRIDIEGRKDRPDAGNFNRRARLYAGYLAEELAAGRRPDALFVCSDSDVPTVTAACRMVGLDPSRDLDVLGFDGYWERTWEREREPLAPAATIRADHVAVGRRLLALALREDRARLARAAERIAVELRQFR